ncbi:hypothetical protein PPUJ20005_42270 [Pseudomonas putida]|nr:hypothetical protein PPUJ20005_42270 [Pseudomonas putida]
MPAFSRARPLPQVLRRSQQLWGSCGSGQAREEAGTDKSRNIPVTKFSHWFKQNPHPHNAALV